MTKRSITSLIRPKRPDNTAAVLGYQASDESLKGDRRGWSSSGLSTSASIDAISDASMVDEATADKCCSSLGIGDFSYDRRRWWRHSVVHWRGLPVGYPAGCAVPELACLPPALEQCGGYYGITRNLP